MTSVVVTTLTLLMDVTSLMGGDTTSGATGSLAGNRIRVRVHDVVAMTGTRFSRVDGRLTTGPSGPALGTSMSTTLRSMTGTCSRTYTGCLSKGMSGREFGRLCMGRVQG